MNEQGTYLGRPVAYWVEFLRSEDALLRRLGCHALGEIGPAARATVPELTAALRDPQRFVRVWAAAALAAVEAGNPEALAALAEGTHAEQGFVRSLAAWHLGRLGTAYPGVEATLPRLTALLEDRDRSVAKEAFVALRRLQCKAASPPELDLLWNLTHPAR